MKIEMSPLSENIGRDKAQSIYVQVGIWTSEIFLAFVVLAPFIADGQGDSSGQGNILRQLIYALIFAAALFCARISLRPKALVDMPLTLLITLAWFLVSLSWASNPGVGARRLVLTLLVIWSVFLLSSTVGYQGMVQSIRRVLPLVLLANFCAVLLLPGWAIHQAAVEGDPSIVGAWRGVLMQKNFAGVASALTIIFFAFDAGKIGRTYRWTVIVMAAIFLYQTNSRTSMSLLIASMAIGFLYRFYRPYYRWMWSVFLALSVPLLVFIIVENRELMAAPFADPDAFTGRVHIWMALLNYAGDHLLLGSGFGSFWNAGEPHPLAPYTRGWVLNKISSGHSGFLDLLAQTGLPGLILSIFSAFLAPLWIFMKHETAHPGRAGLLLALIMFCFAQNLTESGLFDRDATVQVFLMIGIALLHEEARKP
jgi:hypothetical protein